MTDSISDLSAVPKIPSITQEHVEIIKSVKALVRAAGKDTPFLDEIQSLLESSLNKDCVVVSSELVDAANELIAGFTWTMLQGKVCRVVFDQQKIEAIPRLADALADHSVFLEKQP